MTARDGMANLITRLRGMTNAGTVDYTIAGVSFWSDDQLQDALDRHRTDLNFMELEAVPEYSGGALVYKKYSSGWPQLEEGDNFAVLDSNGNAAGTASYTADYQLGAVTFGSDQAGAAYFLNARSYDLYAASADIWRQKAAHAAERVSWSSDNMRVDASQYLKHCEAMVKHYSGLARMGVVDIVRGDEP